VLTRGICKYCEQEVVWGLLANGRYRSFAPELVTASEVPERERFALPRRGTYLIDLEGIRHDPSMKVLTPHYCASYKQAKQEEREMRNVVRLADLLLERV